MSTGMESDKYTLIVRNLQEVIGENELHDLLKEHNSSVSVYWGTATTGKPHVAYFVPVIKLADMLQAGAKVTVLFADLHAYLDNMKAPWSLLRLRTKYYEAVIKAMFRSICIPLNRLHFIRGADYQLTEAYSVDVYRLMALTSIHDARKAGAEVVKQVTNPLVSGLLYPLLQALDEVHLKVDIQFGGYLPHLGHKKRIHLMNPMVPGLTGGKMSSSEIDSKIDLLDLPEFVASKLASSVCPPSMTAEQGNGVLAFLKYVIFPLVPMRTGLSIPRTPKPYFNYIQVEKDYLENKIPADSLRSIVTECLNGLLETVQNDFKDPKLQELVRNAYPVVSDNSISTVVHEEVPTLFTDEKSAILLEIDNRVNAISKITDQSTLLDAFEKEFVGCRSLLEKRLTQTDRLRCLWSITPIGLPHLGHSIPLRSLARLSHINGVYIIVLINNISAHLHGSCPWDVIIQRGEFCRVILTALFTALGGNLQRFSCILGSDFQLNSLVPESDCLISSNLLELDKSQTTNDHLIVNNNNPDDNDMTNDSSFLRHFPNRFDTIHLTHPMLCSLQASNNQINGLLSLPAMRSCPLSSRCTGPESAKSLAALAEENYIPLVEPPSPGSIEKCPLSGLKRRIKRAFCQPNNIDINPILDICRWVLIPDLSLGEPFVIPRSEKNGGPLHIISQSSTISEWDSLKQHFANGTLHPGDLKPAVEYLLSINNPNGLANRLSQSLPNWNELMMMLDAAFPLPISQSSKKKGKQSKSSNELPKNSSVINIPANQPITVGHTNAMECCREVISRVNESKISSTNSTDELDPNRLDIRIGLIISVKIHPSADTLFVEEVDFGPNIGKKIVVSGLAGLYPMEKLLDCYGVFVINLKPTSSLLKVQLLHIAREQAVLGERFVFHSLTEDSNSPVSSVFREPDKMLSSKTKLWEHLCPDLSTCTTTGRYIQWRDWRLGSIDGNKWITVSNDVPPGSTVR
ncbi:Tyrosine--tRNA ligase, cytoplasmic [Schistosoma japonicum]|nr:Tyrosine--tRNA ligase, cytoplasmic [Schistosoma japonicum]KAH8857981.1 Tyrosine--tRNA ligase, cytoplasmic [Schistosoma japonicum]